MSLQVNALLAKGEYFFVFRANVSHDIAVFLVSRAGHHGAAFSFTSLSFACEPAFGSALLTKKYPPFAKIQSTFEINAEKTAYEPQVQRGARGYVLRAGATAVRLAGSRKFLDTTLKAATW